jgi:hypothetical protein
MNRNKRVAPAELSIKQLAEVHGGITALMRKMDHAIDHAFRKVGQDLKKGFTAVGKEVVKVAEHTPIGMAVTGLVQGAKTHNVGAALKGAVTGFGEGIAAASGVSGIVDGAKDHDVKKGLLGGLQVASNVVPGVGSVLGKVGATAVADVVKTAGTVVKAANHVAKAVTSTTGSSTKSSTSKSK